MCALICLNPAAQTHHERRYAIEATAQLGRGCLGFFGRRQVTQFEPFNLGNFFARLCLKGCITGYTRHDVQAYAMLIVPVFKIVRRVLCEQFTRIESCLLKQLTERTVALILILINFALWKCPRRILSPSLDEHALCPVFGK